MATGVTAGLLTAAPGHRAPAASPGPVDRTAGRIRGDRREQRRVGDAEPHLLTFHVAAGLRRFGRLVDTQRGEGRTAGSFRPIRRQNAAEEQHEHHGEDGPALTLIADHAVNPLPARPPDVVYRVSLTGGMMGYARGIDGRTWAGHAPPAVRNGQFCAFELFNHSMMTHPVHLHGHHFQVAALNGQRLWGAIRDTVLVPPMEPASMAFHADNPGRWLFHCRNLCGMMAGMMMAVGYV